MTITPQQEQLLQSLEGLYREWNAKINVISRKDIDNVYEHHVLHSLAIAKYLETVPGLEERFANGDILDLGPAAAYRASRWPSSTPRPALPSATM